MSVVDLRDRCQNGDRGGRASAMATERMTQKPRSFNRGPWIGIGLVLLPWLVGAVVWFL